MEEKKEAKPSKRSFANIKEGQAVFYKIKGEKYQGTVVSILNDKGLALKVEDGNGVRMSSKDAEGIEFKDSNNVLWTLK